MIDCVVGAIARCGSKVGKRLPWSCFGGRFGESGDFLSFWVCLALFMNLYLFLLLLVESFGMFWKIRVL